MKNQSTITALYIHIPFCSQICHYCDFAKTANFDTSLIKNYFIRLKSELEKRIEDLQLTPSNFKLESIFLGGGTPGLFGNEIADILRVLEPYLVKDIEISLETNPENVTNDHLISWKDAGVNRVSIGVQSFQKKGLKFLTRTHDGNLAIDKIQQCMESIPNTNIDLIYGWKNQSLEDWQADLNQTCKLQVPHVSCYQLTIEPGTVFGRRLRRGVLTESSDEVFADYYNQACKSLNNYNHEEVSNWSRGGYSCKHNWKYWSGEYYLAIGLGSHGYLPKGKFGTRYANTRNLKKYIQNTEHETEEVLDFPQWKLDFIVSSLRTELGVSIAEISRMEETHSFKPTPAITRALAEGMAQWKDDHFILSEEEWYRETAWALQIDQSFSQN